ncbi:MAG: hypothetical protein U5L72_10155 [Bacteroidales bacterium]|nr:hypothetical protein [Bacteroidales bacterium]
MSTRRAFIKKGGLTAGGLATVSALGAGIMPDKGKNSGSQGGLQAIKITAMFIEPVTIKLDEPFHISLGVMTQVDNALVTIVLENGIEGYGEAAPIIQINGENQATILGTLNSCREFIVGQDINCYRSIAYTLKSAFWAQSAARCAIEMALLDAYTKTLGIPLYRFLGGTENRIETDYTISIVPAEEAKKQAIQLAAEGVQAHKDKSGDHTEG